MSLTSPARSIVEEACDAFGYYGARDIFSEMLGAIATTALDLRLDPKLHGLQILLADFDDYELPGRTPISTTPKEPIIGTVDDDSDPVVQIAIDSTADVTKICRSIGPAIAHEMFHLYVGQTGPEQEGELTLQDYLFTALVEEGAAVQYEVERYGQLLIGTDFYYRFVNIGTNEYSCGVSDLRSLLDGLSEENGNEQFHTYLMSNNRLGYRTARFIVVNFMKAEGIESVKQLIEMYSDKQLSEIIRGVV